jgi:hypothetical protein
MYAPTTGQCRYIHSYTASANINGHFLTNIGLHASARGSFHTNPYFCTAPSTRAIIPHDLMFFNVHTTTAIATYFNAVVILYPYTIHATAVNIRIAAIEPDCGGYGPNDDGPESQSTDGPESHSTNGPESHSANGLESHRADDSSSLAIIKASRDDLG